MQLELLYNFELIHYFPLQSILHLQLFYDWSDFDSLCTLLVCGFLCFFSFVVLHTLFFSQICYLCAQSEVFASALVIQS
jgi:hypothetical protein